uniref:EOG090X08VB n=1 Tax=Moina brachiata TaxID=675436 RepID=A0A4Y7NIP8_9CRUS|nr:EOG090X08VB [Moina brachiata]SVE93101.1 EOG090X08VB [Moina brachiata]
MASTSAALEGLPKQFVLAMKTLFEVMDDKKTGFVKLSDLEAFWSEEGLTSLPKGVVESLRKVTPPSGLLSFERFCAGLKICLLRYQSDQQKDPKGQQRSPSAPLLDLENGTSQVLVPPPVQPRSPTATVRPNNAMLHSRTISMPHLVPKHPTQSEEEPPPIPVHMRKSETAAAIRERRNGVQSVYGNVPLARNTPPPQMPIMGPPKPPRVAQTSTLQNNVITNGALMMRTRSEITVRPNSTLKAAMIENKSSLPMASVTERAIAKAEVRTALQQWQLAQMDSEKNGSRSPSNPSLIQTSGKRREPRRHTLQNGVDQSLLRRIQVLEQERQALTSGLQAIEKAQEWFQGQLSNVQERIRSLGKTGGGNDYSFEAQQERLGFKITRIEEVSRQLMMLIENADRGLPNHMNLALIDRNKIAKTLESNALDDSNGDEVGRMLRRLKIQNHQLTEEVGRKSERITMLEKDKSSLIRELFQARSQTSTRNTGTQLLHHPDDTTLINTMVLENEKSRNNVNKYNQRCTWQHRTWMDRSSVKVGIGTGKSWNWMFHRSIRTEELSQAELDWSSGLTAQKQLVKLLNTSVNPSKSGLTAQKQLVKLLNTWVKPNVTGQTAQNLSQSEYKWLNSSKTTGQTAQNLGQAEYIRRNCSRTTGQAELATDSDFDRYTVFHNPNPNYEEVLQCAQEAVYPLYSLVFVHYGLCVLMLLLVRPWVHKIFHVVDHEASRPIYAALYLFPTLTLIHGLAAGLIYYAFPYIIILLSLMSHAFHFASRADQSWRALLQETISNFHNLTVVVGHWVLHGFGLVALTMWVQPQLLATILILVPLPTLLYVVLSRFTDPVKFHND